jgi:DNA-binding transcriptional regulator YdaS (Cro superfamily)
MINSERSPGLRAAIEAVGGVRALARAVGISHVSVIRWYVIPIDRLFVVEEITGVSREKLRPDIFNRPRPKNKPSQSRANHV